MNLTLTNSNAGSRIASVFAFKKSATVAKAAKSTIPVYYVEDCLLSGELIDVDYTLNDEWLSASIKASDLRVFVLTNGLNDYCFDSCVNGMHVQDAGSFEPDTFIAENLNACVKAYLQSKRIGQNVN